MIPDLTEGLVDLSDDDWHWALANLRETRLLGTVGVIESLDTHPLVRSYFGHALRERHPQAWREGNLRLYEHLQTAAPELPETLEDMLPLYSAVVHGCQAGEYQRALLTYTVRIQRTRINYSTKKLGAVGEEVAALSGFLKNLWYQPYAEIEPDAQSYILNEVGVNLRYLGRLKEAENPLRASFEHDFRKRAWSGAAISANNLSELMLCLGDISQAVYWGRKCVDLADRGGDSFIRAANRTALGDALHQAGQLVPDLALSVHRDRH